MLLLRAKLLKQDFIIIGGDRSFAHILNKKKIKILSDEFNQILHFLLFFGNELKQGTSQENAFYNATAKINGTLKLVCMKLRELIIENYQSFDEIWKILIDSLKPLCLERP